MQVVWLDLDKTHAVVIIGWFCKRRAEVHLRLRGNLSAWYYGPPAHIKPQPTWSATLEVENIFYERCTPLNKSLADDMHHERRQAETQARKAKEAAHWTQVQDLPKAKLLPTRTGSLT